MWGSTCAWAIVHVLPPPHDYYSWTSATLCMCSQLRMIFMSTCLRPHCAAAGVELAAVVAERLLSKPLSQRPRVQLVTPGDSVGGSGGVWVLTRILHL